MLYLYGPQMCVCVCVCACVCLCVCAQVLLAYSAETIDRHTHAHTHTHTHTFEVHTSKASMHGTCLMHLCIIHTHTHFYIQFFKYFFKSNVHQGCNYLIGNTAKTKFKNIIPIYYIKSLE